MHANQEYSETFESLSQPLVSIIATELKDETSDASEIKTRIPTPDRSQDNEYTNTYDDEDRDSDADVKSNPYTETFENDEFDTDSFRTLSISKSKSKVNIKGHKHHIIKLTIKEEDEQKSDNVDYSDTFDSVTGMLKDSVGKQNTYTESFCSMNVTTSTKLNDLKNRIGRRTSKAKTSLQPKGLHVDVFDGLKKRIEMNLTKSSSNDKLECVRDVFPNLRIKDKLFDRLKSDCFLDNFLITYDEKLRRFGDGLVDQCFPGGKTTGSLIDYKKSEYFRMKCEQLKFKQARTESTDPTPIIDSLNMIGRLASQLPRHTTDPEIIWTALMKPLTLNIQEDLT
jgi:hypothetical protein